MRTLLSAPLSSRKLVEYLLLFLLLASVLSAAVYGGYWYGKRQVKTPQTVAPKAKEPTPKAADETAGWKTYADTKYQFAFSYPQDYIVSNAGTQYTVTVSSGKDSLLAFRFDESKINATRETGEIITNAPSELPNIRVGEVSYPVSKYLFAEGVPSEYKDCFNSTSSIRYLSEINESFLVELSKFEEWGCNPDGTQKLVRKTTEEEVVIAKQILSTFRFLDQEATGETEEEKISVTIPPDWETYDKDFAGTHFVFKYPPTHVIFDLDPASGELYVCKASNQYGPSEVVIDNLQHAFSDFKEYKSGSRRAWFVENLTPIMQGTFPGADLSGLTFKEVDFDNGKSYLKVGNWPAEVGRYSYFDGDFYFGVQGNVPVFLLDKKIVSKADILKVLSSLTVSK